MTRPTLVIAAAAGVLVLMASLACAQTAHAAHRPYTVANQHSASLVPDPGRFSAIIGYTNQCVAGIACWTYTKGTRSKYAAWPEAWYLHVGPQRVMDRVYHLYVMDPRSRGWQLHVATVCGQHCFIDGVGPSSLNRDEPVVPWTPTRWVRLASRVVAAVRAVGKQALPNSVGGSPAIGQPLVDAAGGRASTEAFNAQTAAGLLGMGRMYVAEQGDCAAKYALYTEYKGAGDHFSCFQHGALPWDLSWMVLP